MNKSYTGGLFEPSLNPLWIHLNPTVSVMVSNTKREWIVFIALRSYKEYDTENVFTIMSCVSKGEMYTAIHSRTIPGLRTCGRSNDQFHSHVWEVSHKDLCENFKAHVKVIFFSIRKNVVWNMRRAGINLSTHCSEKLCYNFISSEWFYKGSQSWHVELLFFIIMIQNCSSTSFILHCYHGNQSFNQNIVAIINVCNDSEKSTLWIMESFYT